MPTYVYVAWFRDPKMPVDDQDYEWPGCWAVKARSKAEARRKGDRYALSYAGESGEQVLWSRIDDPAEYEDSPYPLEPLPPLTPASRIVSWLRQLAGRAENVPEG